jgi:hypothetical protein
VRAAVQTATGRKRTQFLPVAGGGLGGGAAMTEIEIPDDEDVR